MRKTLNKLRGYRKRKAATNKPQEHVTQHHLYYGIFTVKSQNQSLNNKN